ncbi:ADP-ribosylation factor GTPase-activating protein AGD4, partial [Sesamum alatum]
MAVFIKLEDSPMFQKQVRSLEQTTDELRDRCQKLYKGCKKYMEVLGEACNGDMGFAASLEAFGGGLDDLLGVSIGGPVLSRFISALRELATYKEFLRSQVEHVLVDRLSQFLSVDLQDAKDSRRRFDKAIHAYDQARDKFASLKKNTRDEVVAELEEDLHNSKSAFEKGRFNLVQALMNVEAKKKFEFLESFSAIMDAHLRYFKLGYDLLNQMEPFIHQVLTYAQQSKEQANVEQDKLAKRIQEFRTQSELNQLQASHKLATSSNSIAMNGFGMTAYKSMEAIMLATANDEVQTIKQGYLLKRSSSLRADWKRRFFILDSQGTLYYYRNKGPKVGGSPSLHSSHSMEHNHRVFSRFRARHHREALAHEECLGCSTVDLRTSTIKIDAEDTDLRLCFRIISPLKTYTLQAETEADRMDWMNKITGVITSLLNSHLQQVDLGKIDNDKMYDPSGASFSQPLNNGSIPDGIRGNRVDSVPKILREVPGNDQCAECSASDPDWASLNLGILMCIECSGIHRNLGVHISKIRSVTLDVKVWEPTVLDLFQALGNAYCNSVWEELLPLHKGQKIESEAPSVTKPSPSDTIHQKEKYIEAKYVRKLLVNKEATAPKYLSASTIWEAVRANNLREVYRIAITSDANIVNSTYDDMVECNFYDEMGSQRSSHDSEKEQLQFDRVTCERIKSSSDPGDCFHGCSLLHLACHNGSLVMLELLLQLGADINKSDLHGRTPLQHCILKGNNQIAKFLLRRGARASIRDAEGFTALERAMEMGAITDEQLFILLAE